jgi:hypothetical protein
MDEEISVMTPSVGCADSSPARGELNIAPLENTDNNLPPCGGGADQREAEGVKRPLRTSLLKSLLPFLPPVALTALFYAKESDRAFMDAWVENFLTPFIQAVGRFWSIFPFSAAEVMTAVCIAVTVLGFFHTIYILVKNGRGKPP